MYWVEYGVTQRTGWEAGPGDNDSSIESASLGGRGLTKGAVRQEACAPLLVTPLVLK